MRRAVPGAESARRRDRGERGVAAVEAAIITPVLLLLVFGILEFSLLIGDYVGVTSATRTGARIASSNAGAGPSVCDADETNSTNCNNTSAPELAKLAANAVQVQGSLLNKDQINYMFVYKSNAKGFPGAAANATMPATPAACASIGNCVVYVWNAASNKFVYSTGSWSSPTIDACATEVDSVGIYLNATHPFITKLFGTSKTLSDRTVMAFEPLSTDVCKPGAHL